jgi:YggT family protein
MSVANEATVLLVQTLISFLGIYQVLLLVRVLLTWFQTMDWANRIASVLSPITDPFLNLFRSIIPPLGGMDFSPILAFFAISILQSLLISLA